MFKLVQSGYIFVGESLGVDISSDVDSVVNSVGKILTAKMRYLYEDRDYSITYFRGLPNYYFAKSVAFEVRTDLYEQNIGKTKFEVVNSVDFPGTFDLKVRVNRMSGEDNSSNRPQVQVQQQQQPTREANRSFESQYGSGSRWDLSRNAPVELVTRESAPTNNDIFTSTWDEVANDSVTEFYSSLGVSL